MTPEAILFGGFAVSLALALLLFRWQWPEPGKLYAGPRIGPLIGGENRSKGVEVDGNSFTFPLHGLWMKYFTKPRKAIKGDAITVRYRIDAEPGVRFINDTDGVGMMFVYFQKRWVNWFKGGVDRFYCVDSDFMVNLNTVEKGVEHTMVVPLDCDWVSTMAVAGPELRQVAAKSGRWGVVFGGGTGAGHGVYATGKAKFTLIGID